jgi:hypothetical protein
MLNCLILITKTIFSTSLTIPFNQIVFREVDFLMKKPHEYLNL